MTNENGLLVLIPTPIGNLEDITLRALRYLREADVIACEDTRHTSILLREYHIEKPLLSYHEHNEQSRSGEILDRVEAGEKICVVSDAGMPGISDPGQTVLSEAIRRGLPYTVLPGPSAAITAFVASGLGEGHYLFWGFLPRKGAERQHTLEIMDQLSVPTVIYEAPHRIRHTMEELTLRWPDREYVLIREWTKQFEEAIHVTGDALDPEKIPERGEYAVVIGAAQPEEGWSEERILKRLEKELAKENTLRDAVKAVARASGAGKNEVYALALEWQKNRKEDEL